MNAKTKTNPVSFSLFKDIVSGSLALYPQTWWRILGVNLFSLGIMILVLALLGGIGYGVLELSGIPGESFLQGQIPLGKESLFSGIFWSIAILGGLLGLGILILGKIASLLVIKRKESKRKLKNTTLWKIYTQETRSFFWRYILNGLRIFWYIVWPLLIILAGTAIILFGQKFLQGQTLQVEMGNFLEIGISIVAGIAFFFILIRRSIAASLSQYALIIKDISSKEALETSITKTKGRKFRLFFLYAGISLIALLVGIGAELIPALGMYEINIEEILVQIILPPFALAAQFLLTSALLKTK